MGITPGPWEAQSYRVEWEAAQVTGPSGVICDVFAGAPTPVREGPIAKQPIAEANARAIAKVPEMVADWEAIATENPPQGMTFKQWVRGMANKYRDLAAIDGDQGK